MCLTGRLEENSHLPAEMMARPRAASVPPEWRKRRLVFRRAQGAPRPYCRGLCRASCVGRPRAALWLGFLADNADLEKQSVWRPHGCLEVPRVFLLFLLLRNNGISVAPVASVRTSPPHNGPIQSPTKSDCPKFNGLC